MVASSKPNRLREMLAGILLLGAVMAAYQPAWSAGYIWDDDMYVTQNRLLAAPDGLKRIWFSRDAPSQYFPLTYTVLRLERKLWGLRPAGYHCLNLLLHGCNAIVLWRLLRRLDLPAAWLGAALFALHPVNVESVAWISELKNILALFFYLLALRFWTEFIDGARPPRNRYYFLALSGAAFALFSKTTACTLPAGLVLLLWLKHQPLNARRCWQIAPFLALSGAMGVVAIWWERFHQNTVGAPFNIGWPERFLIASRALWFYAGKFLWPFNLAFIYPKWQIDRHELGAWLWPALTLLVFAALFCGRRFIPRGALAAALFYVAALSPLLGFVMEYTFRYTFVADHYQYIAMIAPCALVAGGINRGLLQFGAAGCAAFRVARAVLLVTLGVLTWRQSRIYHDSETLWRANIVRNPAAAISHNNLAAFLIDKGQFQEAINESQSALSFDNTSANAHNNFGLALLRLGRVSEAIQYLEAARTSDPGNPNPPYNLGQAALARKEYAAAANFFNAALALKPDFPEAQCNLGFALLQAGRAGEAIAAYETALQLNPDYALAHNDLGSIFEGRSQLDQALAHFERATEIMPEFVEAQCNLGDVLARLGRRDEAAAHYEKALATRPGYAPAENRLRALRAAGQ